LGIRKCASQVQINKRKKVSMMQKVKEKLILFADLESSSSRKELLTALFESSVINTLIFDITCSTKAYTWKTQLDQFFLKRNTEMVTNVPM
jgi:hypothetical protein